MARRPIRAQADQSRWRTWSSYKPVTVHQASCWAMMRSKARRMGRRIAEGQLCYRTDPFGYRIVGPMRGSLNDGGDAPRVPNEPCGMSVISRCGQGFRLATYFGYKREAVKAIRESVGGRIAAWNGQFGHDEPYKIVDFATTADRRNHKIRANPRCVESTHRHKLLF